MYASILLAAGLAAGYGPHPAPAAEAPAAVPGCYACAPYCVYPIGPPSPCPCFCICFFGKYACHICPCGGPRSNYNVDPHLYLDKAGREALAKSVAERVKTYRKLYDVEPEVDVPPPPAEKPPAPDAKPSR